MPSSKPNWIEMRARVFNIIKEKSFSHGSVSLASGKASAFYFDMKPTMLDPEGASLLAKLVLHWLEGEKVDRIGGLEIGAVLLISPLSAESFINSRPIPGFFVRKAPKDHGTRRRIEGADIASKNVVILDDVTTTGQSAMLAVKAAQEAGARVTLVLSIVDRQDGAAEHFRGEGIPFKSLFTAEEFLKEIP